MAGSQKSREKSRQARASLDPAQSRLTNSDISELLAMEPDNASQPLQRAFRLLNPCMRVDKPRVHERAKSPRGLATLLFPEPCRDRGERCKLQGWNFHTTREDRDTVGTLGKFGIPYRKESIQICKAV